MSETCKFAKLCAASNSDSSDAMQHDIRDVNAWLRTAKIIDDVELRQALLNAT